MTNKEIEKLASKVWDKLIAKPYEIGKRVGEGMKMLEKLDQSDSTILFVEIDNIINNLRACGTESIKRFVNMILLDFSALADVAESNFNGAKTKEEKEESELTWRNMMGYKIDTHKYRLEDMASIADSIERKISMKLKNIYPSTHDYFNKSFRGDTSRDARLEGFRKINEQDDIME